MARILIIDDDPETVEMLGKAVSLIGHAPITALGWELAQPRLQEGLPDLLLLDLMMPDIDGYEVMRRLRARDDTRGLPIIVITASPDPHVEQQVADAGGNMVFHKPISIAALNETIDSYLPVEVGLPAR